MNNQIVNKLFNPNVRFKTVDKPMRKNSNDTCNVTQKSHHEINIHSETNIPLTPPNSNGNGNFRPEYSGMGSNFFHNRNQKIIIKEGPYQVDQDKLDKVFKRS